MLEYIIENATNIMLQRNFQKNIYINLEDKKKNCVRLLTFINENILEEYQNNVY